MRVKRETFGSEADMVAAVMKAMEKQFKEGGWTAYHETAGWDVLLVHESGPQIGIEAKLTLNAKVLEQALPSIHDGGYTGPDFRAVLVPTAGLQAHLTRLAACCGITVLTARPGDGWANLHAQTFDLPNKSWGYKQWHDWHPAVRCRVPEYVPDVIGGHSAPVQLSEWKIKAIKLLILLDRRGFVTRKDMKALQISPTRWTDGYYGYLDRAEQGYVRNSRTPDLKAQHPGPWEKIEADFEKWALPAEPGLPVPEQPGIFDAAA